MNWKLQIESWLQQSISALQQISGGDIGVLWKVQTTEKLMALKVYEGNEAISMIQKEYENLNALANSQTIGIPKLYGVYQSNSMAGLLMEYIEHRPVTLADGERLGSQLWDMHRDSHAEYGWKSNNFVGSLPQLNPFYSDWPSFWCEQRLAPQMEMAIQQKRLDGRYMQKLERIFSYLEETTRHIRPSLLHGDLWSGNYLIREDGKPFLIDPATYYGHSWVDIAMSKLFGGFPESFYKTYSQCSNSYWDEDILQLYQLYYLLIHLNLFGDSYAASVCTLLKRY